ncbi:MAG: hypothetical protein JWQ14_949 [Adhaeribacter sp.]|jgi:hypothetical protein|nr:hypothetical protein [Adhaeribacter sp.]
MISINNGVAVKYLKFINYSLTLVNGSSVIILAFATAIIYPLDIFKYSFGLIMQTLLKSFSKYNVGAIF